MVSNSPYWYVAGVLTVLAFIAGVAVGVLDSKARIEHANQLAERYRTEAQRIALMHKYR